MKAVTFNGPAQNVRMAGSGRLLIRGVRGEVTDAEAERLVKSRHDVTVHTTTTTTTTTTTDE